MKSLYPSLLGPDWERLPPSVRRLHAELETARGRFEIRRGTGLLSRLIGAGIGLPGAVRDVGLTLVVERSERGEFWQREFGGVSISTKQWGSGGLLVESLGPVQCWFQLAVEDGVLLFRQVRATFGTRSFSVPLPGAVAPQIRGRARSEAEDQLVGVEVEIRVPVAGMLIAYAGVVTTEVR